jgi:glycosyltransferase involved in cell wall biosynthesis
MRLAWFSPMPPVPSGIAACSAELVAALSGEHRIDVYVDEPAFAEATASQAQNVRSAHEFIWRHRADPYDLTVYQVGNSSHHDYLWPYLFRYPGLTVLHDAHLHHARAAALLRTKRAGDYRAEFAANHPAADPDLAELAIAGFDSPLYYSWPMTRLVIEASRLAAVHAPPTAAALREELPHARVEAIRLAHGETIPDDRARAARRRVRAAHGIPEDAIVFGVFGGLTPEKRVPQVLDALPAVLPHAPSAHLLLAGAIARHYDVAADVRRRGLDGRVAITGYLETESELTDCLAACDVSLNLRWPTAREMSGPWLRALAAGLPTVIVDLAHLADVPSLDPRTWRTRPGSGIRDPVTIAIDILDEDHSLRLAMRRLASDAALRASVGAAGLRYWEREHSMPRMIEDYRRVIAAAAARPAPAVALPPHLVTSGDGLLNRLLSEVGVAADVWGPRPGPARTGTEGAGDTRRSTAGDTRRSTAGDTRRSTAGDTRRSTAGDTRRSTQTRLG